MTMLKGSRVRHATYGLGTVVSMGLIYRTLIVRFDWMCGGAGKVIRMCELSRTNSKGKRNAQKPRRDAEGCSAAPL